MQYAVHVGRHEGTTLGRQNKVAECTDEIVATGWLPLQLLPFKAPNPRHPHQIKPIGHEDQLESHPPQLLLLCHLS